MKTTIRLVFILLLASASPSQAQYFQSTISATGNDLVFKIKPKTGGGNISTDWSVIEFFVRYPTSTPVFTFGAITINSVDFPGIVIPFNGLNAQGSETGYVNAWFGNPFGTTSIKTYNDGQEYEVFRVTLSADPTTLGLELIHNQPDFYPTYITLTSGTGGLDRTAPPGIVKFYGANAGICEPVNCPVSTNGNNHVVPLGMAAPVEWLAFEAFKFDMESVRLNWSTASEYNSSHFDIERSLDGVSFALIGRKDAAGESTGQRNYSYIDAGVARNFPQNNAYYYRITEVDKDESRDMTPIRSVDFESDWSVRIWPNPFSNRLYLSTSQEGKYAVRFFDVFGRMVHSTLNVELDTGEIFSLDNSLEYCSDSGILWVVVSTEDGNALFQEKLVRFK